MSTKEQVADRDNKLGKRVRTGWNKVLRNHGITRELAKAGVREGVLSMSPADRKTWATSKGIKAADWEAFFSELMPFILALMEQCG